MDNFPTQRNDAPCTAIATEMATTALVPKAQTGLSPMAPPPPPPLPLPLLPLLPLLLLLPLLPLLPLVVPLPAAPGDGVGTKGGSVTENWEKSVPVGTGSSNGKSGFVAPGLPVGVAVNPTDLSWAPDASHAPKKPVR
jgi:hypothetical protein